MNLDNMAEELHETASDKGFWDPKLRMEDEDSFVFYAKQIAMIHSEATEVLEAIRKDMGQRQVVEELADILIRVLDLYAGLKRGGEVHDSLHDVFLDKARYNMARPKMHNVRG